MEVECLFGGFKYFLFSPLLGEVIQFDSYFSKGLKTPTRYYVLSPSLWKSKGWIQILDVHRNLKIPIPYRIHETGIFTYYMKPIKINHSWMVNIPSDGYIFNIYHKFKPNHVVTYTVRSMDRKTGILWIFNGLLLPRFSTPRKCIINWLGELTSATAVTWLGGKHGRLKRASCWWRGPFPEEFHVLWYIHQHLGGGFKYFSFPSLFGEDSQFD